MNNIIGSANGLIRANCPASPAWTNIGAAYWNTWIRHQNCVIDHNTGWGTETYTQFGALPVMNFKWNGGVLAENGCIYCSPQEYTKFLKIDTRDDSVSTFGDVTGVAANSRFRCSVLAGNGMIYVIPSQSSVVAKIDPTNDTYTTFGALGALNRKWSGAVVAPSGIIYCIPASETYVLKIDPSDDSMSSFGAFGAATLKWLGGVVAPNGKIYCIPDTGSPADSSVLVIDPSDDSTYTFGNRGTNRYRSAALATNGKIYCIPQTTGMQVMVIDPVTDTVSFIGAAVTMAYSAGIQAANGLIYSAPLSNTFLRINPANNNVDTIASPAGSWQGILLAPNGSVYCLPHSDTTVLKLSFTHHRNFQSDVCLNGYNNRF